MSRAADVWTFDTDHDGRLDFSLSAGDGDRLDVLGYDDDQDGRDDRVYRLSDYAPEDVPHLIVLLDSIPYASLVERYAGAGWTFFDPPQKVIPPFPTMSGVIFTDILGAPPLPGMINRYYDRGRGRVVNLINRRARGHIPPWQRRLDYHAKYWENGLAFLRPRDWCRVEMARVKEALDTAGGRTTVVYLASPSGMVSRYGRVGVEETLDALEQLCLQLLHERCGALKISVLADHGHNLLASERIDLDETLEAAGFRITDRLRGERDVVFEIDGMVNYLGLHTRRGAEAAGALLRREEVQLAAYLEGERVIVRDARGSAAIERRAGEGEGGDVYRYTPLDGDPLGYADVGAALGGGGAGLADADGFIPDRAWFDATLDHEYPDAPHRLWRAFHGLAVNTPDVMVTLRDGYSTGMGFLELFITMASTHGGLNQVNSATFVMTMTGRATGPLRSRDVLRVIAPGFTPLIRRDPE